MKRILITAVLGLSAALFFSGCNLFQTGETETETTPETPTPTPTPAAEIQVASISGTLSIEGAVVQNTTALMLQRRVGEAEYTEFARQPAADGMEWSFDQAIAGVPYEITAALQVSEENAGTSNVVTTSAPSSGEELLINTELHLPAPSSTPRVDCGEEDSSGRTSAIIYYPHVEGAAGYYYQVGAAAGKDDVDKGYTAAPENPNDDPSNTLNVQTGTENFTRYAYTACIDCNVYDLQNWSQWSPTLSFTCPASE